MTKNGQTYITVRVSDEENDMIEGLMEQYKKATKVKISKHSAVKLMMEWGFLSVMENVIGVHREPQRA